MNKKIGLLVITHGDLGCSAIASAELVIGKQDNYNSMNVFVIDQIDELRNEMLEKIDALEIEDGLVVMTDIVGGTPINLASQLLMRDDVIVLSGINLPLLITFFMEKSLSIDELKKVLKDAYEEGFVIRTYEDMNSKGGSDEYSL